MSIARAVPASRCVQCAHELEAATPLPGHAEPDAMPTPGSLTLCIGCGKAYMFGQRLELAPVDLELLDIDPDQLRELRRAQRVIVLMRAAKGGP